MTRLIFGKSPFTTITGYLMAVAIAVHQMAVSGSHDWKDYLVPVLMAIFGRLAGDEHRGDGWPPDSPSAPLIPERSISLDTFVRRGKKHLQVRNRKGQFATIYHDSQG